MRRVSCNNINIKTKKEIFKKFEKEKEW